MSTPTHARARVASLALTALAVAACGTTAASRRPAAPEATAAGSSTTTARAGAPPARVAAGSALATVARLVVKGRAPMTGYDRARFGEGWVDVDRNGCDTRDDVLRRDLRRRSLRAGTHGCVVVAGTLRDPYTATAVRYVRGRGTRVDIDHVVALGDAWQTGAQRWSEARRVAFANDPLDLLAVSAGANRAKGDADAASWLPPNAAFRCAYVARQVAVKAKYGLAVTAAERDAFRRVLRRCPRMRLPRGSSAPVVAVTRVATTPSAASAEATSHGVATYASCAAARAAGIAPIRRPGALYEANARLDRDRDGVACD